MKLILLHILVYATVYVASVALIVSIMGLVNLLLRKPFRDRWRHNLSHVAVVLMVGLLIDLISHRLLFAVGLPAGVLSLGAMFWFFIKCPSYSSRQESTSGKKSV